MSSLDMESDSPGLRDRVEAGAWPVRQSRM